MRLFSKILLLFLGEMLKSYNILGKAAIAKNLIVLRNIALVSVEVASAEKIVDASAVRTLLRRRYRIWRRVMS